MPASSSSSARVFRRRPWMVARAWSSQPGLRSPLRNGSKVTPWPSGRKSSTSASHPFAGPASVSSATQRTMLPPSVSAPPRRDRPAAMRYSHRPWRHRLDRSRHDGPHRRAGAEIDHHRRRVGCRRADVAGQAVAHGRKPRRVGKGRPPLRPTGSEPADRSAFRVDAPKRVGLETQGVQGRPIPAHRSPVEQAAPRGRRYPKAARPAKQAPVEIFAERDPTINACQ